MLEKKYPGKKRAPSFKGQAIVEFAIVLPILLMVVIGLLEVGRYILIYSSATNASRNAARYASAVGLSENGLTKFNYCEGIKQAALNSIFLVPRNAVGVAISYDDGAGTHIDDCDLFDVDNVDPGLEKAIDTGDRAVVTVTVPYKPMVKLVPFDTRNIVSSSARTILGIISLDN